MRNSKKTRNRAARLLAIGALCCLMAGCGSVDITKTSSVAYAPTDPKTVDIIKVTPYRPFEKLGTLEASGFDASAENIMQSEVRTEAAAIGANAVILDDKGLTPSFWGEGYDRWMTGEVIRYNPE